MTRILPLFGNGDQSGVMEAFANILNRGTKAMNRFGKREIMADSEQASVA